MRFDDALVELRGNKKVSEQDSKPTCSLNKHRRLRCASLRSSATFMSWNRCCVQSCKTNINTSFNEGTGCTADCQQECLVKIAHFSKGLAPNTQYCLAQWKQFGRINIRFRLRLRNTLSCSGYAWTHSPGFWVRWPWVAEQQVFHTNVKYCLWVIEGVRQAFSSPCVYPVMGSAAKKRLVGGETKQ